MSALVGLRVVRALDGRSELDRGTCSDGYVGTLIEVGEERPVNRVDVLWDSGSVDSYTIDTNGMHGLRIFDSAPTGARHSDVMCDACNVMDLAGLRWKCIVCYNFDLCTACYMSDQHDTSHAFFRVTSPDERKARLPPRAGSLKSIARGLFPGATVVRGRNWRWGDQDAGGQNKRGTVVSIANFASKGVRDAVRVQWTGATGLSNGHLYRAGYGGNVDVQCESYGDGGSYYPDHLPLVGASTGGLCTGAPFEEGDRVKCLKPQDELKVLQKGHGEWNEEMSKLLGKIGIVRGLNDQGDAVVQYYGQTAYITYNPAALVLVDNFKVGDGVKICEDLEKVKACHDEGRWDDGMRRVLGEPGKVIKVYPDGDICVEVDVGRCIISSICVLPIEAGDAARRKRSSSSSSSSQSSSDSEDEAHRFMRLIGAADGGDGTAGGLAGALAAAEAATGRLFSSTVESRFKAGDKVRVTADRRRLKTLQKGHGCWVDDMEATLGEVGKVKFSLGNGDVRVKVAGDTWTFNPDCLESIASADAVESASSSSSSSDSDTGAGLLKKLSGALQRAAATAGVELGGARPISASGFERGDIVTVITDLAKAKQLQVGHGEWVAPMETILGQTGKVVLVFPDGDLRVKIGDRKWSLNPQCCTLAGNAEREALTAALSSSSSSESSSEDEPDPELVSALLGCAGASGMVGGALTGDGLLGSRLLYAVTQDDASKVRDVLSKSKAQVNGRVAGKTLLMLAAHQGNVEIVRMLLEAGADVSSADDDGYSALHYAAAGRKADSVRLLLESGAQCNATNKRGHTPLHLASAGEVEDVSLVKLLLESGSDTNARDSDGDTPLMCAIEKSNRAVAAALIAHPSSDLYAKNNHGCNALHHAVQHSDQETARAISLKVPTILEERTDGGMTALHMAAEHGERAIAEILLKEGKAAIERLTERQETPLLLAIAHCQADVADMLLDCGASVLARDERGNTCLHLAIMKHQLLYGRSASTPSSARSLELIRKLLNKGADPKCVNAQGRSAEDLATGPQIRTILTKHRQAL